MLHPAGAAVREFFNIIHGLESPKVELPAEKAEAYRCVHWIFPSGDFEMPLSTKDEEASKTRRRWYDPQEPQPGLQIAIDMILGSIDEEAKYVPRTNIFLGGVGQGMGVALATFLVDGTGDFAGLIGLSGFLPMADLVGKIDDIKLAEAITVEMRMACKARAMYHPASFGHLLVGSKANAEAEGSLPPSLGVPDFFGKMPNPEHPLNRITPILICNSYDDETVPASAGLQAFQVLSRRMGLSVSYRENLAGTTGPTQPVCSVRGKADIIGFILDNMGFNVNDQERDGAGGLVEIKDMFLVQPAVEGQDL